MKIQDMLGLLRIMEDSMKTKLEQVLERCLNGREIAIWGSPTRSMLRALKGYKYRIAENVDPKKHYVVAVNSDDEADFLMEEQSGLFKHVDDYLTFNDIGGGLPFEWECFGAKIGRQTYFSNEFVRACDDEQIESIGHFTAINDTAYIDVNHQLNMTTISDDIQEFLTEDNLTKFIKKVDADPKHPYARNKKPLTIGSDVWISAHVFINASTVTSIGHGAIIGTGTVVLEDVPPYAVVVGVPGKIKRYRYSPEMIETLLRVKWWEWSIEEINANTDALISPEIFMQKFGHR